MTKLKAFADDKFNIAKITISLRDKLENTVGKEENAAYQHFLLFPQCFPKPSSFGSLKGSLKVGFVWQRVKTPSSRTRCVCETLMPPETPIF